MEELAINGGGPVREPLLGYGHQSISDDDVQAVVSTLKSDYLTCGPATERFEDAIREATGARYAGRRGQRHGGAARGMPCGGGRGGDEAIVSPITFAASANCVLCCGGTPVFADIDPRTWNIFPRVY